MTDPLTLPVVDPAQLAAGLMQLKADRAEMETLTASAREWPAELAAAVKAALIDALKAHDALKAERDRVVNPIYKAYKNASDTYKPHLDESDALIKALRAGVGAYDLAQHERKQLALQTAQTLVLSTDALAPAALAEALEVANSQPAKVEGVATRFEWRVKRIVVELLPGWHAAIGPYWTPNMTAIDADAERQGTTGDEPPVIPGVVFERVPLVTGRRK